MHNCEESALWLHGAQLTLVGLFLSNILIWSVE